MSAGTGDGTELLIYRQAILEKIINDKEICEYILGRKITEIDADIQLELLEDYVFPFGYVPDTQDEMKLFLCFEIDNDINRRNNALINVSVPFYMFCCKDIRKQTFGQHIGKLRTDLVAIRINELFNNQNVLGIGDFECKLNKPLKVGTSYYGRWIAFDTKELNASQCGT